MDNNKLILSVISVFMLGIFLYSCGNGGKKEKPGGLYEKTSVNIDLSSSLIHWTARRQSGKVEGTLKFSKGYLKLEKGMPVSGTCTIDMNSIRITGTGDTSGNSAFTDYLKSEAFFNVNKYPEALFTMNSIIPLKTPAKPDVNTTIKSSLTIKDSTLSTGITALTNYYPDSLSSRARFSLNGELWNIPLSKIKYGKDYGKNPFKEDFDIDVFVVAR